MEERYWNRFTESGSVTDYLYYRGLSVCQSVMQRYDSDKNAVKETGEKQIEPVYVNGNGA